ncbi:hypothetical protein AQ876_29545 [Burkholderia pseudomallei]|nr:hypothetical protein AQ876_29545 [Burkholderia pseudomallei]
MHRARCRARQCGFRHTRGRPHHAAPLLEAELPPACPARCVACPPGAPRACASGTLSASCLLHVRGANSRDFF